MARGVQDPVVPLLPNLITLPSVRSSSGGRGKAWASAGEMPTGASTVPVISLNPAR
ncbi:MAG: hypothetical protein Ct9H300mP11_19890 [Chloroflexota bacterium]|nr:MAG: hypothetical protein Ct9H300mP11_19890 [Chloroflexota bacterium]